MQENMKSTIMIFHFFSIFQRLFINYGSLSFTMGMVNLCLLDCCTYERRLYDLSCCFNIYFQILTKDSVTVHVDAIMYYKVSNAICAISNVDDYGQSTRLLAATTLR